MTKKKQIKTTIGEFLNSLTPKKRKTFDEEYRKLLISELLIAVMQKTDSLTNSCEKRNYLHIKTLKDS